MGANIRPASPDQALAETLAISAWINFPATPSDRIVRDFLAVGERIGRHNIR